MREFFKNRFSEKHFKTLMWWDYIVPAFVFLIAFICFDQAYDMKLTMFQSSDLLDCIFAGKPFDFYRYTLDIASTTGYFDRFAPTSGAIYNIVIYFTMAIWALPVYVLNLIFHFTGYASLLNIWGRILVIGLSIFCAFLLTKLSKKISSNILESKWIGYLFLTSPILIFCVVIFNQYDIFCVTATLLALLFYLDKKYYKFSMMISLAICYKLFPIFVFIPLIALAEKRLYKLFIYFAIAVSLYFTTTFLWSTFDIGYNMTQSIMLPEFGFYQWVFKAELPAGISNISIFIFSIIVISALAYWLKPDEPDFPVIAIYLAGISYMSFFVFVDWHPQWMVILLPFLMLILFRMKDLKLGIILETLVSIGFMIMNCLRFLDDSIFTETLLVDLFQFKYFGINSNYVMKIFDKIGISTVLPMTIFAACLFTFVLISFLEYRKYKGKDVNDQSKENISKYRLLLYIRSLVPMIYMFFPLFMFFRVYFQN